MQFLISKILFCTIIIPIMQARMSQCVLQNQKMVLSCSHGKWDCDYISKTGMCLGLVWCLCIRPLEGRLSHVIYLCVFVTTYRSQNKISTNDILAKIKQKGGNSNYIFPFLMYTVHTREKEV